VAVVRNGGHSKASRDGIKIKRRSRKTAVHTAVYQQTQKSTITDTSDPIKTDTVKEGLIWKWTEKTTTNLIHLPIVF
jgi:hypothetical protein